MEAARKLDPENVAIARKAAANAGPYVNHLVGQYNRVCSDLRSGRDTDALRALGALTEDLETFLKFLVLINDYVSAVDPRASKTVSSYRERLLGVIESIEPALADVDLVEVADAIEDDLVPALAEYHQFDAVVRRTIEA
jgi:hypothetical protein